jgi:hypothetical protein
LSDEQRREHDRLEARIDRVAASGPLLDIEEVRVEALRRIHAQGATRAERQNTP